MFHAFHKSVNWTILIIFLIPMIFSIYFLLFSREQESNKSFAGFPCPIRIPSVLYPAFPTNLSYLSFLNQTNDKTPHPSHQRFVESSNKGKIDKTEVIGGWKGQCANNFCRRW